MHLKTTALAGALLGLALLACKKEDDAKPESSAAATTTAAASASAGTEAEPSFEEQVKASTPLDPKPKTVKLGTQDFTPELCKFEEPLLDKSGMSVIRAIEVVKDKLYLVGADGKLRAYNIGNGCSLSKDTSFGDGGVLSTNKEIKTLSKDDKGNLLASNGLFESYMISGGKLKYECKARGQGYIAMHPSGKWGLGSFANATVNKLTFGDSACESEPWVLQDMSQDAKRKGPFGNVNTIGFMGDTVLVGGILPKSKDPNESRVVIGMDANGKEKFRFGKTDKSFDEQKFGWVHAIGACKPGICVVDSNFRRLSAWKKDGSFFGAVKLSDAFDLKYPWVPAFSVTKDGTAYFAAGQSRDKSKVSEGLIYRVKGM
ncbi:MAG: hypothetical protein R3B07_31725 [Polyangiaceae bacterium]